MRIKENKEVYEGEVTELTPEETENPMGGYGKTVSHVVVGLKTTKGKVMVNLRSFPCGVSFGHGDRERGKEKKKEGEERSQNSPILFLHLLDDVVNL